MQTQKIKNALAKFHNPYSCAQTVYAAFAENPTQERLDEMKRMSGGRAEGGLCGALFAAKAFVPAEKAGELAQYFESRAGSRLCREIKAKFKTPCADCVRIACEGVEKFGKI